MTTVGALNNMAAPGFATHRTITVQGFCFTRGFPTRWNSRSVAEGEQFPVMSKNRRRRAASDARARNEFRASEKRWQRKRLFGKQRTSPVRRFVIVFLTLASLAILAWWQNLVPLPLTINGILP